MADVMPDIPTTPRRLRPAEPKAPQSCPAWPPPHFPDKLQELCKEFEDILVTELEANQQIQCTMMEVKLIGGTKPFFARRPRKNPLHWDEKIKKEVKKLLKEGVIEKVPSNETAQWISPAGFVSKDEKEEKLRLICDLRELNKAVEPDSSVFPTPSEVMQSLKVSSQWFIKADLLQGYHQLELATESRNLFCFALESGIYRYLRCPMGYSRSSHYFNKVVQKHLEDIPQTHVEVDDLLIEGANHEEAIKIFRTVLERCREKNIKLARHKLEAGPEVDFAGIHIGGPQGFRPTQAKIDALIKLSPPTNLTELRSFIG